MFYSTPEKFHQTLAGLTLSARPDAIVLLNGYKGPEMYFPLGNGMFQKHPGDERILISAVDDGATRLYENSVPELVFYKVPWYGTTALIAMLTTALLISLAFVFGNIEASVANQVSLLKPALLIPYIVVVLTFINIAGSLYEWVSPK